MQPGIYWSGTEISPGIAAWNFRPFSGFHGATLKDSGYFAVAVRPGDAAASVSGPQTLALALLALGVTVVARRRRPR